MSTVANLPFTDVNFQEGTRITIIEPYIHHEDGIPHGFNAKNHFSVQDVGLILPQRVRTQSLGRGQMGYVIVGVRDPRQARPGTIMTLHQDLATVLNMTLPDTGLSRTGGKSVLYASVHPSDADGFGKS